MLTVIIRVSVLNDGGAQRVAVDIAKGLADLGHNIILATDLTQTISYQPSSNIKLVHVDNNNKKYPKLFRPIAGILKERKLLKCYNPDAYIGIMSYYPIIGTLAKFSIWKCKAAIIYSDHDSYERPNNYPMSNVEYYRKFWFSRICTKLTVLTQADKDFIGNRLKNVVVMPNPLTLPIGKTTVKRNQTVLACGRLNAIECKGFDILLKAWSYIERKYPEWNLAIAGDGKEEDFYEINKIIKNLNLNNRVQLLGYISDIEKLYSNAEIFVLSSRYEGFGLVLIEAMSQGCACIACDYKGRQREIIEDGVDGVISEVENVQMLADKISFLIENESLRKSIQEKAPLSAARYSIPIIAKKWEKLLKNLLKKDVLL